MNRAVKIALIVIALLIAIVALLVALLAIGSGWRDGNGPFDGIFVSRLAKRNVDEPKGGIVFYGASNFTRWTEINEDLAPYHIINNGFGGSDDKRLVKYVDKLVFPYEPELVFFQTGSNDYLNIQGTDEERVKACMEYKKQMFESFHDRLPGAKFIVMSGLLLPGRSQYVGLTMKINAELEEYCDSLDYMYFIDAMDMTYNGASFRNDLFAGDGIHLNRDGQKLWAQRILPILGQLY
jgi:lysophospholipase L1-like esterase